MRKILSGLLPSLVFFIATQGHAENKFWIEGSDQPKERVNTDLKTLSPKAYLNVSEKVNEAIVNVSTTREVKGFQTPFGFQPEGPQGQNPFTPFFGPEFFGSPTPRSRKESSLGSGFLLNKDGYIVTNNHVIAKADEIQITFFDETESTAKIIGRDTKTDIALLKVDKLPAKIQPVLLGDSDAMKVGEVVVAIGNPFGLSHSVTQGIISAKERAIGLGPYDDFIQTDASINPGNSGGPLLNLYGEVIGINTAIQATGQGIGFAIPINGAKVVLQQLRKDGKVTRSQLGVQIQKITEDHVKALQLKNREGALVSSVLEGSPAANAGIKAGDVIVSFDEKKIKDWQNLPILVANTPVGKRVNVGLIRNGVSKNVSVQLSEQKDQEVSETAKALNKAKKDMLGLVVQNLTKETAQSLGLGVKQKGVLVSDVDPNSEAYTKGVHRGDVIIEVNRKNVTTVQEYDTAVKDLKKGDSVLLLIVRKQGTLFIAFELP